MKKRNDNRQLLNNEKIKNLLKDYKYAELSGKDTMDFLIEMSEYLKNFDNE